MGVDLKNCSEILTVVTASAAALLNWLALNLDIEVSNERHRFNI